MAPYVGRLPSLKRSLKLKKILLSAIVSGLGVGLGVYFSMSTMTSQVVDFIQQGNVESRILWAEKYLMLIDEGKVESLRQVIAVYAVCDIESLTTLPAEGELRMSSLRKEAVDRVIDLAGGVECNQG